MFKIKNKLFDKINNFMYKIDADQQKLLDTISNAVLMAEQKSINVAVSLQKKIKKEQVLHVLIDLSNKLIKHRLDHEDLVPVFEDLISMLQVDSVYLSKLKYGKFNVVKEWGNTFYNKIDYHDIFTSLYYQHDNSDVFHKCFSNKNSRECVFPIVINDKLWGTLCLVKRLNDIDTANICIIDGTIDCYWNKDQVQICSMLSTIFSSHLKTYKLIDDLGRQSVIIDSATKMTNNTYMWAKDYNGKYIWSTLYWKKMFFGDDTIDVIGKTDKEILNILMIDHGYDSIYNTYSEICERSDKHCIIQNDLCFYIEGGYIGKKFSIFETKKKPIMDNNRIIGTIGVAKDLNVDVDVVKNVLSSYLGKDVIGMHLDSISYWIKTEDTYNKVLKRILQYNGR